MYSRRFGPLIGTGTAFAACAIAEGAAIGAENAQRFAFADAGVDPAAAQAVRTEFDYEQGQFVYEVEFVADGTEYEYWIRSTDGAVVKKRAGDRVPRRLYRNRRC